MTTPMAAADVRRTFIEFFRERAHNHVPSSPTVPHDDPTLMFANAGMNQFKPVFLGDVAPGSPLHGVSRAVNSQKCIRAGGKHNDLDDVGKDTYHHTFFEMLGNWSFGDYFKAEAIDWAWELLTKVYGLDPKRLYATYFGGDEKSGLAPDDEAKQLWLKHLPPERVIPGNMKDNFWEMGDTGPCGPCSELHYDRVGNRDASADVNAGVEQVIEIWNLVFIQYDRQADGSLRPLPAKHVDTGMGLERLAGILAGKASNYDTDLFTPIFAAIQKATGARPYTGKFGKDDTDGIDTAYRVIADHARTLTISLTDGAVPSNEGRGYVLRRILRRAVRFGRQRLNAQTGFIASLVPTIVEVMGEAFPELRAKPDKVRALILDEEQSFGRTLDRGIEHVSGLVASTLGRSVASGLRPELSEKYKRGSIPAGVHVGKDTDGWFCRISSTEEKPEQQDSIVLYGDQVSPEVLSRVFTKIEPISAADAFQLYDTYGFPIDLTQVMAEERGLSVDVAGFEAEMEAQKQRSRAASKTGTAGDGLVLSAEAIDKLRRMNIKPTDDAGKFSPKPTRAAVKAIWNGANFDEHVTASTGSRRVAVVLGKTPFYAEMGGQIGDKGRLEVSRETRSSVKNFGGGGEFTVEDTQVYAGYVVHIGHVRKGEIRVGDDVTARVDERRRKQIAANHTATHLLNLALRRVLGEADQKGSLVADDRLRFDFTSSAPVTPKQLAECDALVQKVIESDLAVHAENAPLAAAKAIASVRAVFGETYPDPVRVVSIGPGVRELLDAAEDPRWRGFSIEFCGGTHLAKTGEAQAFAITGEEAVAKGVRRITALTGVPAQAAHLAAQGVASEIDAAEKQTGEALKNTVRDILESLEQLTLPAAASAVLRQRVAALQAKLKDAGKAAAADRAKEAGRMATALADSAERAPEPVFVTTIDVAGDMGALQAAMKTITERAPRKAVMLLSADDDAGRVSLLAVSPKTAVEQGLKAGDWIREVAGVLGGKGGGRPEMAQGSGSDVAKVKDAVAAARHFAISKLA